MSRRSAEPRASPASPPPAHFDVRAEIAARSLAGEGIEIGALHAPLALPPSTRVRYIDRMTQAQLRAEYPELAEHELVEVDQVDDGERLDSVGDGSVDFIVANHFLEHCQDPIGTVLTHVRKLAPGGALFYAVPDKRFTFDVNRPVTPLSHLMDDHVIGAARSRASHYDEWTTYVYDRAEQPERDPDTNKRLARRLEADGYSIHFHAWTQAEILALFLECRDRLGGSVDIEVAWRRSIELIVVLRLAGEPRATPSERATSVELRSALDRAQSQAAELKAQNTELRGRTTRAEGSLKSVATSTSWRLTAPFRTARRWSRARKH